MRQVCIATFHGAKNYGSALQATALRRLLMDRGYDPFFLKAFRVGPFYLRHPMLVYARIYNKLNRRKNAEFFRPSPYDVSEERARRIREYVNEHCPEVAFTRAKQWNEAVDNGMICVSGGDILWNPARGYPAEFFLDFAYYAGLPCFSYGSSIGARELPERYFKAYRRYLGSFYGIGVREAAAAKLIHEATGLDVQQVLDSTLLLSRKTWNEFAERAEYSVSVSKDGYVLCYFVMEDDSYWDYVAHVREATGLQAIVLPMHYSDEKQPYDVILDGTPYEFIDLIKNAAMVVTDSFHACVFSLIYKKEFYLLRRARKAEDDKYNDFLGRYGLTSRAIEDRSVFVRDEIIDWDAAYSQLTSDKNHSTEYLDDVLGAIEE